MNLKQRSLVSSVVPMLKLHSNLGSENVAKIDFVYRYIDRFLHRYL